MHRCFLHLFFNLNSNLAPEAPALCTKALTTERNCPTMDTNVLPKETLTFHLELDEAIKKLDKREARSNTNAGYGATVGGMAITTYQSD